MLGYFHRYEVFILRVGVGMANNKVNLVLSSEECKSKEDTGYIP